MKPSITQISRHLPLACIVASVLASAQPLAETAEETRARIVYDDADPSIQYAGQWYVLSNPRPPDPNLHYSLAYDGSLRVGGLGSTATLTFYGKTITFLYSKAYNRGSFAVRLNGQLVDPLVSAYSDDTLRQVARTYVASTQPGLHTIEVRGLGGGFDVDAFQVDLPFAPAGTYDNRNSYVRLVGFESNEEYDRPGACEGTLTTTPGTGVAVQRGADLVSFPFSGNQITYYYTAGPDRGLANVVIDGVDRGKVDLWAPVQQRQSAITFSGLDSRPHVIHISVAPHLRTVPSASTLIDLDRFDVGPRVNCTPYLLTSPAEPTAAH